jgi:pyruvate dehydrogenase E2 component (dihydrolipoamide acetyltransferase)
MIHNIVMPDLGQTTSEGKILRWLKKPGDRMLKGEPLMEVETDKVTMEVEAYRDGYVRALLVEEGQMASAMSPIAIVTDSAEEPYEKASSASAPSSPSPSRENRVNTPQEKFEGISAAPTARALAREIGVDLNSVKGTGPGGFITRMDVQHHNAGPSNASAKPMAAMAALTSKSKQTIPHFYVTSDVDVSSAEQWRVQWNAAHPDLPATANDVFVRAASNALRDVPSMNLAFENGRYEQRLAADVLLIVAVQPSTLALVPLADPGSLSWEEYLRAIRKTLSDAKQGLLKESSLRGGPLLAISNLGMHGVKEFAAIIPLTCTAALAIGVVREAAIIFEGKMQIGRICSLKLSADHRVIDGITAAKFLQKIQEHLNAL